MITRDDIRIGDVAFSAEEFASQGNAILGIRDSGKSYTATCLAEQLLIAGIPIVAFDPIGIWRYLRVPGTGAGFPVVVAGGEHGDLPLTPESAPEIVRAAMRENVSLVLDLYSMALSKADWKRIVEASVRVLLYENRAHGLRHIFIEEAAEFAPQRIGPDQGRVYAEIEKLARMGGNSMLGYTLINQRAEEVNKAVLELCDCLFLHRQKGRNSLAALAKWLDIADAKNGAKIIKSLPQLGQGECWVWPAGTDQPKLVKIPTKRTFHPNRRMTRAQINAGVPAAPVDVAAFVGSLKAVLAAEPGANESPSTKARRHIVTEPDPEALQASFAKGFEAEYLRGWEDGCTAGYDEAVIAFTGDLTQFIDERRAGMRPGKNPVKTPRVAGAEPESCKTVENYSNSIPAATPMLDRSSIPRHRGKGAEMRVLKVLAQRQPAALTTAQWATLAILKKSGGTWSTYVSRLKTAGYVERDGDRWRITPAGIRAAGQVPRAPRPGPELIASWKASIGGGAARMLDVLVSVYPNASDRANLADRLNMAASGGTFLTYLSRLKSNGLVTVQGRKIRASEALFDRAGGES